MNMISTSKLLFLLTTFFVLLTFVNTPSVLACSCVVPGTPTEELERVSAVFSGTVTDIDQNFTGYGYKVKFDVEKTWKGVSNKTVVVSTGLGGGDCGYGFKEGEEYLVYSYSDNPLNANICSRTRPISSAKEDLLALGEGNTPPERPSDNSTIIIVLIVIVSFVAYRAISSRKKIT